GGRLLCRPTTQLSRRGRPQDLHAHDEPTWRRSAEAAYSAPCLSASRGQRRISRRHPAACAYLRSVAIEGECRWLPPPASSRATAGVFVPIRAATSACVSPACRRALSSSSSRANSSAWASYSALTAGRLSSFLTNA